MLGRLTKFIALEPGRRGLLARAWLLTSAVRVGLWTVPFSRLCRVLDRFSRPVARESAEDTRTLVWAVKVASRYFPRADTCLTQALAVQLLLRRRGRACELRLGVAREGEKPLMAHAWVESEGRVVIGATRDGRYTVLTPPEQRESY